jgi:hypothetical protein
VEYRLGLDLREARTWDDIVAGRAAQDVKPGEWIVGRCEHQSKWDRAPEPNVEGFPLHGSLSAASPNNPALCATRSACGKPLSVTCTFARPNSSKPLPTAQ